MSLVRALGLLAVIIVLLLVLRTAAAAEGAQENRERAREHYNRALAHLRSNELERALAELLTAQELHPHYAVLYNIGEVHASLGDPVRAVESLERYLEEGGQQVPPTRRQEVERLIAKQSERVARVALVVIPEAAKIKIDGAEVGTSPLARPLVLLAGHRELLIQREGYRTERRSLELRGASEQTIRIELQRAPRAPDPRGFATVEVDCPVADVTIRVDGHPYARTPVASMVVPVGVREIVFARSGYRSSKQSVIARPENAALTRCGLRALEPLPARQAGKIQTAVHRPYTLRIDGTPAPSHGRVPHGRHRVEISKAGYRTWTEDIVLTAGTTLRVTPDLEPTSNTLLARQSQRTWAYALGITGAGLLAASVVTFIWNDSRHSDWQRRQQELDQLWLRRPPLEGNLVKRQTENDELLESVHAFDRVTTGLGAVGAALVIGGGVLYFTGENPEPRAAPTLALTSGGAFAGWDVSW